MTRFIIKIFCWINNFSYKVISFLAIKENGGIHPKHRILNYHQFFLDNISANDSILDIGCGNGAAAFDVAGKAKKVTGIDISGKNIEIAEKRFKKENLEYLIGDATAYDFKEKFDAIILSNVLEHIKNRVEFLQKISRLAPKIIIRVPLLTRDWLAVYKKESGLEYRLDKDHFIEYTLDNLNDELTRSGLKLINFDIKFGEIWGNITKK
jgi:2-polyprenyl-3-methyl-5-hydroxy-6-metoxy-1,4-benzoquinol methylase